MAEVDIINEFAELHIQGDLWKFPNKYEFLEHIDEGTYGSVSRFKDTETNEEVAIKRLMQPFMTEIHAKRALRELKLLKFCQHDNLLSVLNAYTTASSPLAMIDLYLVTPWMDMSLTYLIQANAQVGMPLSSEHVELIMYQILRGLKYLHSANVIHRDLKPANITVTMECDVRIIDYGLCRAVANDMTHGHEVQSRPYRAPEVIFSHGNYSVAADMWSVGCILGEMLLMDFVFPAEEDSALLGHHIEICGSPEKETLDYFQCPDLVKYITNLRGTKERKNFVEYFNCEKTALLLDCLLQMDPRKRFTVEQTLAHPYFEAYHDPDDELSAISHFDSSFEEKETMRELKEAIFHELSLV